MFYFDTETFPIREGLLAPRIVCLQYAYDDEEPKIVTGEEITDVWMEALQSDHLLVAHNMSFDLLVLARAVPESVPYIFKALAEQRGRDTKLASVLTAIRDGTLQDQPRKGSSHSLKAVAAKLNIEIEKENTPRLDYALVAEDPVIEWPEEFVTYALEDVVVLRAVYKGQVAAFEPPDEWLQVAAAFALSLAANHGMRISRDQLKRSYDYFQGELERRQAILADAGVMASTGSISVNKVKLIIEEACKKAGHPMPMTTKGGISTAAAVCEQYAEYHPVLANLSQYKTAQKMISTYLDSFEIGTRFAMPTAPNPIVATGRTSWGGHSITPYNPWMPTINFERLTSGTNLQNLPRVPGIRECFTPREGFYFCSVDYNSLELRTLGQACLWLIGHSTFAEGYQKDVDWDPHTYFGGQLLGVSYEEALILKATDSSFKKGPRQIGKTANFSLPGGVGARTLLQQINTLHKDGLLTKSFTEQEAYDIKEKWLEAYPEMPLYFEIADYLSSSNTQAIMPRSGRRRGGLRYTAAANNYFQGIAADLAKRALYAVTQACYCEPNSPLYQSRVVAFIHDEILLEVPIDSSHDAAMEAVRLMVREAQDVCPNVPFAAEPALCEVWDKNMEPTYDEKGRLIPWKRPS
jgi:hypothetical protein